MLKWLPSDKCKLMKAEDVEYIETKEAKAKESKTEDTKVVETEEAKADTDKAESYISFKNESLPALPKVRELKVISRDTTTDVDL